MSHFLEECLVKIDSKMHELEDGSEILNLFKESKQLVQDKINGIQNSNRKCYFLCHLGLGDNIIMIGCVRYLSLFYDEVYVISKIHNMENVKSFYADDPSIKVIGISNLYSEHFTLMTVFQSIDKTNTDIFISGFCHKSHFKSSIQHPFFLHHTKYIDNPKIRFQFIRDFYKDINMDANIYHQYFHVPSTAASKMLYDQIKDYKIIFCHTKSSSHEIDVDLSQFTDQSYLVINPNKNMYPLHHPKFEIAQKFVNLRLLDYLDTIKNASAIRMTDSSFCCLIQILESRNELTHSPEIQIIEPRISE